MFGFFRGRTSPPASMDYAGSVHFRLTCSGHLSSIWFSEPCFKLSAIRSLDLARDTHSPCQTVCIYRPPCRISAQTMRAILFASATMASIGGLRLRISANHRLGLHLPRLTQDTTALAPTIKSRLRVCSPILDVRPNRCFPPLDRSNGVRPTHAAKSRPFLKVESAGERAANAVAVIGPIPGIDISRLASSSSRARFCISLSNSAIWHSQAESCCVSKCSVRCAAGGRDWSSSIAD